VKKFIGMLSIGANEYIPLILLQSSFSATVKDWTGRVNADATLKLQLSYYNETYNVWEPIIEPILNGNTNEWESWQLSMKLNSHNDDESVAISSRYSENRGRPSISPKIWTLKPRYIFNLFISMRSYFLTIFRK